MKFAEYVGIGALVALLGCGGEEIKQQTLEKKAETAPEYKTLKGKVIGFSRTTKDTPWYFILEIDKEQQPFEIEFSDDKEYERMVRILEKGNYLEVDVDKNKYMPRIFEQVPSERIRQSVEPEKPKTPEQSAKDQLLEHLVKGLFDDETLAAETPKEYVSVEGKVIGGSYYEILTGNEAARPTRYFFAIQTQHGIKTIETTLPIDINEEIFCQIVAPGNEIQVRIDKNKVDGKVYKVLPDDIALRVVPVIKEGAK